MSPVRAAGAGVQTIARQQKTRLSPGLFGAVEKNRKTANMAEIPGVLRSNVPPISFRLFQYVNGMWSNEIAQISPQFSSCVDNAADRV